MSDSRKFLILSRGAYRGKVTLLCKEAPTAEEQKSSILTKLERYNLTLAGLNEKILRTFDADSEETEIVEEHESVFGYSDMIDEKTTEIKASSSTVMRLTI